MIHECPELRNYGELKLGKTNYFSKVAWNSGIPELRNFGTLASWNLDQLPPQAQHVDQRYQRTGAVMVLGDHPQLTAPVTNPFHLHCTVKRHRNKATFVSRIRYWIDELCSAIA